LVGKHEGAVAEVSAVAPQALPAHATHHRFLGVLPTRCMNFIIL
jgi:hypothetical protein